MNIDDKTKRTCLNILIAEDKLKRIGEKEKEKGRCNGVIYFPPIIFLNNFVPFFFYFVVKLSIYLIFFLFFVRAINLDMGLGFTIRIYYTAIVDEE